MPTHTGRLPHLPVVLMSNDVADILLAQILPRYMAISQGITRGQQSVWAAAGQVGTCLSRHLAEKLRCANIKVEVSWTLITLNHILTDVGQLPEHKIMTIVAY